MRTLVLHFALFFSIVAIGQYDPEKDITVSQHHEDDIYHAGKNINIEATVEGDAVLAGRKITLGDSVLQDLIVAGGEIMVKGYVADDIRGAGGKLTIDSDVGDDVIVAGGEVYITKNAIIHGNLINFSGDIKMNGKVDGMIKSYSGDFEMNGSIGKEAELFGETITINGTINGTSIIVAENIALGENAQFRSDIAYWSEEGALDFKNSLMGAKASFDETLMRDQEEFSWKGFGIAALGFWVFYLFSAFLVLILMNWAFQNFFSSAAAHLNKQFLKSLGYGLIYIFGVPLLVIILFVIVIGIPIGLFLGSFYIFSLLFGHLVTSLLLAHYLNQRSDRRWNFWTIGFLALGIAASVRLVTFIPFLGILIGVMVMAIGYGLLGFTLLQKRVSIRLGS